MLKECREFGCSSSGGLRMFQPLDVELPHLSDEDRSELQHPCHPIGADDRTSHASAELQRRRLPRQSSSPKPDDERQYSQTSCFPRHSASASAANPSPSSLPVGYHQDASLVPPPQAHHRLVRNRQIRMSVFSTNPNFAFQPFKAEKGKGKIRKI